MFYVYVSAPGMAARKFPLEKPVTTIGRSSMNDLPISDKMLSRQHARIVKDDDGGLVVEDLGSRNGTFLNGDRLAIPQPLKAGDRITLGGVTLKLESESTTRVRIEARRFSQECRATCASRLRRSERQAILSLASA